MVFVKVTHCRESRRFSVEIDVSFADFRNKVAGLFKEEDAEKVQLQYRDQDGDLVSVSSDEELREAFRHLCEKEGETAQFFMCVKGEGPERFWGDFGRRFSGPHWGMGGLGRHYGSERCPFFSCPAMFPKGGFGHGRCPFFSCPAMFGRGGYGRRLSCPFFSCPAMFGQKGIGQGRCPLLACPPMSKAYQQFCYGGGGYGRHGCPFFSCPAMLGQGGLGGHGHCPFLDCPPMMKAHHQLADLSCGEGGGDYHGHCPFLACPPMNKAHQHFMEQYHDGEEEESPSDHEHDHDHHGNDEHGEQDHHGWGGWSHGWRPHGWRPHGWRRGGRHGWGHRHGAADRTDKHQKEPSKE